MSASEDKPLCIGYKEISSSSGERKEHPVSCVATCEPCTLWIDDVGHNSVRDFCSRSHLVRYHLSLWNSRRKMHSKEQSSLYNNSQTSNFQAKENRYIAYFIR